MGSDSDWKTMRPAAQVLDEFGIAYEKRVVSAHRTPDDLFTYAESAETRGLEFIIAGAGGAAHLPGMTAAKTIVPVVGVPVVATPLGGIDAFLSIMQMPAGVGVATVSVGTTGAKHAALFTVAALASRAPSLRAKLRALHRAAPAAATTAAPASVVLLARDEADLELLRHSQEYLTKLGVAHQQLILRSDLAADAMTRRLADLEARGTAVCIAACRGGIGFACDIAKTTTLPVLGVPIVDQPVGCVDDFLRPFLDMPPGVATFAVGRPGAINAALFAATVISAPDSDVWQQLRQLRAAQLQRVRAMAI